MRPERNSSDASAQAAEPPPVTPRPSSYLRVGEAAEILRGSPKTVCRWAMDGKLPFQRTLGGHRRSPEPATRALAGAPPPPPPRGGQRGAGGEPGGAAVMTAPVLQRSNPASTPRAAGSPTPLTCR